MRKSHIRDDDGKEPESGSLFGGFGARIVRSLFFWGLAAVLASSAYTGIVKLAGSREAAGAEDTVPAAVEMAVAGDGSGQRPLSAAEDEPDPGAMAEAAAGTAAGRGRQAEDKAEDKVEDEAEDAASGPVQSGQQTERRDEARQDTDEEKRVALTFDDGPHPRYTKELLDGLKERDVKATFFVIGKNIPGNEDIIRRMAGEGHLIGNHTYDHVKISDMSREDACEQIEKTSRLVRELTGSDTEFVRPPFGEWKEELECSFVMIPVLWDVDPKDWTTKNVSDIVRRVLQDTEDGDIILLHDCYESSVQAALQIVDALQGQGYRFVTADELILE